MQIYTAFFQGAVTGIIVNDKHCPVAAWSRWDYAWIYFLQHDFWNSDEAALTHMKVLK